MQNEMEAEVKTTTSPAFPSAFDLFKPSIEVLKRNLVSFILLLGVPTLILLFTSSPAALSNPGETLSGTRSLLNLVGLIVLLLTLPGVIILELMGARKEPIEYKEAFTKGLKFFWRLVGLGICLFLIFFVSFLLLIVPFFFALRRYILSPYYMIDRNLGIGAALKMSAEESKKHSGAIWGVIGVVILINLIGIVPVIGMVLSSVFSILYAAAMAIRYLQLKAVSEGKAPVTPIEKDLEITSPPPPPPAV